MYTNWNTKWLPNNWTFSRNWTTRIYIDRCVFQLFKMYVPCNIDARYCSVSDHKYELRLLVNLLSSYHDKMLESQRYQHGSPKIRVKDLSYLYPVHIQLNLEAATRRGQKVFLKKDIFSQVNVDIFIDFFVLEQQFKTQGHCFFITDLSLFLKIGSRYSTFE